MSVRFLAYDEPIFDEQTGEQIGNKIKAITEQEAIKYQQDLVNKRGVKYNTDQDALEDFIAINWAWYVDLE